VPSSASRRLTAVLLLSVAWTTAPAASAQALPFPPPAVSPRAEVEQLRTAVDRVAGELAAGAAALDTAQGRHDALVQQQHAAATASETQAGLVTRNRAQVGLLAREAYKRGGVPRLPVLLTGSLRAAGDLAYLRTSVHRIGTSQDQAIAELDRSSDQARIALSTVESLRRRALNDRQALDRQLAELSTRARRLDRELQAAAERLEARLEADRLAAVAQQERAALATQEVAAAAAAVDTRGDCAPVSSYGSVNGFLPPTSLCPLRTAAGHRLRTDAAQAFDAMSSARAADTGAPLCVTDSYRDYASQVDVFARKPSLAATPGRSQHGWGLAVDLCGGAERFGTETDQWLRANALEFGWVHPAWAGPDGSRPEAWHWEYGAS